MGKKVITLFELENLYAQLMLKEGNSKYVEEYPMELSPAYSSYCRRSWTAWTKQKEKRISQLAQLDLLDKVLIDYYIKTKPITPI